MYKHILLVVIWGK